MRGHIYRMPLKKSSINIEELDENIERIIEKKLGKIYKLLDSIGYSRERIDSIADDKEDKEENKSIH